MALKVAEQKALREEILGTIVQLFEDTEIEVHVIPEGAVLRLDKADVLVKAIVKKERVEVEVILDEVAQKEKEKAEAKEKREKKAAADKAKREKAKAEKEKAKG